MYLAIVLINYNPMIRVLSRSGSKSGLKPGGNA
jgi:hypothetical protein